VHTFFRPFLPPTPHSLPHTPLISRQNMFCPFPQFCWKQDINNNKKNRTFLLVWDKDSYAKRFLALLRRTSVLQPEQIDSSLPDLFNTSRSPSHIDLSSFKVTVLAPLQWRHQMLSSFRFLTYPHTSPMYFSLSLWPKSTTLLHLS
jgi:hypothetical protein